MMDLKIHSGNISSILGSFKSSVQTCELLKIIFKIRLVPDVVFAFRKLLPCAFDFEKICSSQKPGSLT